MPLNRIYWNSENERDESEATNALAGCYRLCSGQEPSWCAGNRETVYCRLICKAVYTETPCFKEWNLWPIKSTAWQRKHFNGNECPVGLFRPTVEGIRGVYPATGSFARDFHRVYAIITAVLACNRFIAGKRRRFLARYHIKLFAH